MQRKDTDLLIEDDGIDYTRRSRKYTYSNPKVKRIEHLLNLELNKNYDFSEDSECILQTDD